MEYGRLKLWFNCRAGCMCSISCFPSRLPARCGRISALLLPHSPLPFGAPPAAVRSLQDYRKWISQTWRTETRKSKKTKQKNQQTLFISGAEEQIKHIFANFKYLCGKKHESRWHGCSAGLLWGWCDPSNDFIKTSVDKIGNDSDLLLLMSDYCLSLTQPREGRSKGDLCYLELFFYFGCGLLGMEILLLRKGYCHVGCLKNKMDLNSWRECLLV